MSIISNAERKRFKRLLKKLTLGYHSISETHDVYIFSTFSLLPTSPPKKTALEKAVMAMGKVVWFKIHSRRSYRNYEQKHTYVERMTTSLMRVDIKGHIYTVMRNGKNLANYNLVIYDYDNNCFYFRGNIKKVIETLTLLTIEDTELPLYIEKDLYKEDKTIFENRLMEA